MFTAKKATGKISFLFIVMLAMLVFGGCKEEAATQALSSSTSSAVALPVVQPEPLSATLFGIGIATMAWGKAALKKRRSQ